MEKVWTFFHRNKLTCCFILRGKIINVQFLSFFAQKKVVKSNWSISSHRWIQWSRKGEPRKTQKIEPFSIFHFFGSGIEWKSIIMASKKYVISSDTWQSYSRIEIRFYIVALVSCPPILFNISHHIADECISTNKVLLKIV